MDKTRNYVCTIPWRYFPSYVENVNRPLTGIVNCICHRITGLVSVQENRIPINRLLCSDHINGSFAGYILGDVNSSRKKDR